VSDLPGSIPCQKPGCDGRAVYVLGSVERQVTYACRCGWSERVTDEKLELYRADEWSQQVCYHESGHMVACLSFDIPTEYVVVNTSFWSGNIEDGHVSVVAEDFDSVEDHNKYAVMAFAGLAAQQCWGELHGVSVDEGPSETDTGLGRRALQLSPEPLSESAARAQAVSLVSREWGRIENLASVLLVRHRVAEAQAQRAAG
jgi:hypothetical protein